LAVLTEKEKQELREMAGSASLREEFRTMERNSRAIDARLSVDQFIQWLTAMARISPVSAKPRPFVRYTNVKI
jgi:hypothetical protein